MSSKSYPSGQKGLIRCSYMGETNEGSSRSMEMENLGVEISDQYPRDLLQTFMGRNPNEKARVKQEVKDVADDGDVQLNLGLSLGGRFGVDKSHGGLMRSSSVVGPLSFIKQDGYQARPPQPMVGVAGASLPRTASLPVETEEEWRKRKQQQTLRRMEAKKRRSEKRSNIIKESGEGRENEASFGEKLERVQQCASAVNKLSVSASLPTWTAAGCSAKKSELGDGVVLDGLKVRRSFFSSLQGLLAQEGSSTGRYQGGSSSAVPVPDSQQTHGSSTDARTPARTTSDIIRRRSYKMEIKDNVKQAAGTAATNKMTETSTGLEDMPCVFAIGDGPNGRKVDGILYKYGKGEEVRIMCVCHGAFFTPVEFVKHAGGCDVHHPLRHIVVNPSSFAFQ